MVSADCAAYQSLSRAISKSSTELHEQPMTTPICLKHIGTRLPEQEGTCTFAFAFDRRCSG